MAKRLEMYILDCPEYGGTWPELILVIWSYNAMFAYVFFGIQGLYSCRTAFHWVLWLGVFFNSTAVWLVNWFVDPVALTPAACSRELVSISEEAAMVTYIAFYFTFFHFNHETPTWSLTFCTIAGWFMFLLTSMMSLYMLQLYREEELVLGFAVGFFWATCMTFLTLLWEPRINHKNVKRFMKLMHIKAGALGTNSRFSR